MQGIFESIANLLAAILDNKIKIGLLLLAILFGPGMYSDWQRQRAATQLEEDRKSIDLDASSTGMLLASAWRSCAQIGIVNNMEGCASYQGRLVQEMAAPEVAKVAIEHRASYYKKCEHFYAHEYCGKLLERAVQLSYAQGESSK